MPATKITGCTYKGEACPFPAAPDCSGCAAASDKEGFCCGKTCDPHKPCPSCGAVLLRPPAPAASVRPPERKDTNPKDACGTGKVPASTIPTQVLGEVGLAMLEGALKYGRHNYRVAGVRASVYYDALRRHVDAWWEGQDTDPDSGLSHLAKAMACLLVLRDSMLQENWTDDRPPKAADQEWIQKLNAKAAALIAKYPNPRPAYTAADTEEPKP